MTFDLPDISGGFPRMRSGHTFCLRQATQAVIFRVISGGLRSPNDSRKALTAGGDGSDTSITYSQEPGTEPFTLLTLRYP